MARLLTEQEVYSIGGSGSYTTNLLCTYARAQAMGCTANGTSLSSNQLVWEGSVKKCQCSGCLSQIAYDSFWNEATLQNACTCNITFWTTLRGSTQYITLSPGQTYSLDRLGSGGRTYGC